MAGKLSSMSVSLRYFVLFHLLLFALLGHNCFSQKVKITGVVYHPEDPTFNLLIVNKTTAAGTFGNSDGTFEITANKTDTILVGSLGYKSEKICMKDSADKPSYHVKLYVKRLTYDLKEFRVFAQRDLDSIQKDIRGLGYDDRDYMLSGIDAINSPLTFLYQQVSKQERMKRRAYEVINEDRRRDLLKELFAKYVSYDIIDLDRTEFEDFVDFMNVTDEQMQRMSQYDFIIYTKQRFKLFRQTPEKLRQDIDTHD